MQRMWTKEEEEYLKSISETKMDIYEISEKLNRTVGSIYKKFYRMFGKDYRTNIIGSYRRAKNRYNLLMRRINNTNKNKNKCYKGIKMEVSKEDFINWFMQNDFKGASVDRIDSTKNYSLDNIRLISLTENCRRANLKEKNGFVECYRCHKIKPLNEMAVDKRRINGHTTICRECDNLRRK